jgi:cytochrome c oxidase cbb3-type subunit 1
VKAKYPYYIIRLLGGLLYLGGMLVMLWNVIKTATNGKPTNILIPAVKGN